MKENEAFYSQRKGARIVRIRGIDKFLSIDNDDDDDVIKVVLAAPIQEDVPA